MPFPKVFIAGLDARPPPTGDENRNYLRPEPTAVTNSRTAALLSLSSPWGVTFLYVTGFRIAACALLLLGLLGVATAVWIAARRVRRELDRPAIAKLESARAMLEKGESFEAIQLAATAVGEARTRRTRNAALTTLAWAALAHGYVRRAKAALDEIEPRYELDLHCSAAVDAADGNPVSAIRSLEIAQTAGILTGEGAKLLVDLYARHHGIDLAVMAAVRNQAALGPEDCRKVVNAACEAGAYASAAILASALFQTTGAPEDAAVHVRAYAFGKQLQGGEVAGILHVIERPSA